jgi:predicted amidohydrolase
MPEVHKPLFSAVLAGIALFTPLHAATPIPAEEVPQIMITPLSKEQLATTSVKVAAVQIDGTWIWPKGYRDNIDPADAVVKHVERAAGEGVQLVAFPELYLGFFPVPNPSTDKIAAAARRHRIYVVVGCFEITDAKGTFYNSSLVFGRDGAIIGRYCKQHPAIGEPPFCWPPYPDDPEWMMTPGSEYPVLDLDFGRVGITTCYDGYFPEPWRILSLRGAEIIIWMNARGGAVEDYIVRTAMHQNLVSVVCTNKAMGSGTMIASWPHTFVAMCKETGEQYISGELPLWQLRHARKNDRIFRQRRPEIYGDIAKSSPVWEAYRDLPSPPGAPPEIIRIEPVSVDKPAERRKGTREGMPLYRLAFDFSQTWMDGTAQLRMPETLRSSKGMHFIDHYREDIWPLSEPQPLPRWARDPVTGEISYAMQLKDGLSITAKALPKRKQIDLSFKTTNNSSETLQNLEANMCLTMDKSAEFAPHDISRLFAWFGGKMQPLSATTPTPEQVGRAPWLLLLTPEGQKGYKGDRDSKTTWWLVDQPAERNLMAAVTKDGRHLIGYTWETVGETQMSNCGYPCLHTGPGPLKELAPGASHTWRGRIYVMDNDMPKLVERFEEDQRVWRLTR